MSSLRKQISERRASERKAMEEATRLDNEDFSDHESEAELTDDEFDNKEETKEDNETKIDEEVVAEGSHENKDDDDAGWMSDSSSEEDDSSGSSDNVDSDGAEGDEESDDELVVKSNKRSAKQLESDSETDDPKQEMPGTASPPIRNFSFVDKEISGTNNDLSTDTKDQDGQSRKVLIDSGIGTSLIGSVLEEAENYISGENFATSSTPHPVNEGDTNGEKIPKRPSEDDTNIVSSPCVCIVCNYLYHVASQFTLFHTHGYNFTCS